MEHKIIIAGFGGQGIVLAGSLLAHAAVLSGKNVASMVSYGAEVRGGTSYSSVIISEDEINSPVIESPSSVIALNQPSVNKYRALIEKGGYFVVNTSIAKFSGRGDVNLISVAATEIAHEIGNVKVANLVAIGALLKNNKIFPLETVLKAVDEVFRSKQELVEANKKALLKGVESG